MSDQKVAKTERKARTNSHEELIVAGVQAICKHGIDNITVSTVTGITGHSRPTFYSYFGDVQGMFAEIWIHYGPAWLDKMMDFEDHEETEWENHLSWAMLQIVAIAHRAPEVAEVMVPDFQEWWKENAGKTDVAQLRTSWLLGIQLGVKMAKMITPDCVLAERVIPVIRAIPDKLEGSPVVEKLNPVPDLSLIEPFLANPLSREDELMQAAAEVVASSGVKAASMARIARKCRVSTGTIYPRFPTGSELLAATFDSAINNVVTANLQGLDAMKNVADQFGYVVIVGQSENRKVWRHFRQEMHLAAMYDHELRKMIKPGFEETRDRLVKASRAAGAIAEEFIDPGTWVMHAIAVGLSLLQNAGIAVGKMDHRIAIRFLGSVISPR